MGESRTLVLWATTASLLVSCASRPPIVRRTAGITVVKSHDRASADWEPPAVEPEEWPAPGPEPTNYFSFNAQGANALLFLDQTIHPAATERLLNNQSQSNNAHLLGQGRTPRNLPPEFAFWMGVVDLFGQLHVKAGDSERCDPAPCTYQNTLQTANKSVLEQSDGIQDESGREALRHRLGFLLAPGVHCKSQMRVYSDAATARLSLSDRWRGFDPESLPADVRRTDDATYGTKQQLSLRLDGVQTATGPQYQLALHHVLDLERPSVESVQEISLMCTADYPLFAQEIPGLVLLKKRTKTQWWVGVGLMR